MNGPTHILLVEDNSLDAELLEARLKEVEAFHFELSRAKDLNQALKRAQEENFDVALLDLALPDSEGLQTFTTFYRHVSRIPIIVLTGLTDETIALQAVGDGAQDFLIKGQITSDSVVRAIRYAVERHRLQELLREQSLRDQLTGLYNRRGFFTLAEQQLLDAQREPVGLSLFFADPDGLKEINDTFGHEAGDLMLVESAKILRQTFRAADIIARFGGDEYVVLATTHSADQGGSITDRLTETLSHYNAQADCPYLLSFSTGVLHFTPDGQTTLDELIREADRAMYSQKERKRLVNK